MRDTKMDAGLFQDIYRSARRLAEARYSVALGKPARGEAETRPGGKESSRNGVVERSLKSIRRSD